MTKFRAWDKRRNKMIDMEELADDWGFCVFYQHEYDHGLEVMQSTERKDRNCVEVFGDDLWKTSNGFVGWVKWSENRAQWVVRFEETWTELHELIDAQDGGVIGNIHENPELIP